MGQAALVSFTFNNRKQASVYRISPSIYVNNRKLLPSKKKPIPSEEAA
jgi:hypothetical protein